jgi:AcrR family transcriptional regulator
MSAQPDASAAGRRPYDTPLRRQQAAQMQARIVAAGCELVHELRTWDWRSLTFRAVAERAGLSERTVYRHFGTERELHNAVVRGLEQEAGVSYEGLEVEHLSEIASRSFAWLSTYAPKPWPIDSADPGLDAEHRRRDALLGAVQAATPDWSEEQRQMAAGIVDVLWNPPAYERLVAGWALDAEQVTCAVNWAISLVVVAMRDHGVSGPGGQVAKQAITPDD